MNRAEFLDTAPGRVVTTRTGYAAFIPHALPPVIPPSWELSSAYSEAERSLGALDHALAALPGDLLVAPFVRREAVFSSRIEGTRASFVELLEFEVLRAAPKGSDVQEVENYVAALNYGVARLESLPMSLRLVRELHARLMAGAAAYVTPGEFRKSQNWIGRPGSTLATATFVPPPPEEMHAALAELERYLHEPSDLPPLIRIALVHYQFETIHPFLDGNGRIGRLLVSLLLYADRFVRAPAPYLSAFIDRHRNEYYRLLLAVSQRGAWSDWLEFFLRAIAAESRDGARRGEALVAARARQHAAVAGRRASRTLIAAIDVLMRSPVQTIPSLRAAMGVSNRTAQQTVVRLVDLGLLKESTGRRRGRLFVAHEFLELLEADTV